jgi:hypothetical protein
MRGIFGLQGAPVLEFDVRVRLAANAGVAHVSLGT